LNAQRVCSHFKVCSSDGCRNIMPNREKSRDNEPFTCVNEQSGRCRCGQPLELGLTPWFLAAVFFLGALSFAQYAIPFFRHDNVVYSAPLIIEAARQVLEGRWPAHTAYLGGGGGIPIIATLQSGVLNPFTLLPAVILKDDAQTMMNVIVAVHLALAAFGCWFMARAMAAPWWVAFVASISFTIGGYMWIFAGSWFSQTVPYAFMPWLIGGMILIAHAERRKEIRIGQVAAAAAGTLLFYAGAPNPAFYTSIATLFVVVALVAQSPHLARRLVVRVAPVAVVVVALVIPLMWNAYQVYAFFGRAGGPYDFWARTVPLQGYMGLFLPPTYSLWHVMGEPSKMLLTNMIVFAGGIPAWYLVIRAAREPSLLLRMGTAPLIVGMIIFLLLMSPYPFGLSTFFSAAPIFNMFRSSLRAIPGLQMLIIVLFVYIAAGARHQVNRWVQVLAVVGCLVAGTVPLVGEVILHSAHKDLRSWFDIMPFFEDKETWSEATLKNLRNGGYVLAVAHLKPYYAKPRLFFHGNLGLQDRVKIVGSYQHAVGPASQEAGLDFRGRVENWDKAVKLIENSRTTPTDRQVTWDNGIAPRDSAELAAKTYISAVVVDRNWQEVIDYFAKSNQWRLIEKADHALLYIRK